jgi:2-polyprenyl-6-methoxyphenol hydroxylase-like FAD-dependent oxidoreductase
MASTHAVVIGGSFSGLFAGRVLSDFFDCVTVLDRDTFPEGVKDRAGVPQARHVHGLLVRGLREYESAFPGFERLAVEKGATFHDHTRDFVVLRPQGWQPRYSSDLKFLSASRELIESCVRDLFRKLPKAELRERVAVTGLRVARAVGYPRCVGVTVPMREGGKAEVIEADLIVARAGMAGGGRTQAAARERRRSAGRLFLAMVPGAASRPMARTMVVVGGRLHPASPG